MNPNVSHRRGPSGAIISGQEEIPESIYTLDDVNKFIRLVNARNEPFDEVSSAVRKILEVVQGVVDCRDLGIRRFAMLDKMQRSLCDVYPEAESFIRREMKTLNSGHDCYEGDHYGELGEQIWAGMYDGSSGTFLRGMYDLGEVCVVIRILRTRRFTLFRRDIVPQLRRLKLYVYVPPEILRKAEEENARELAALRMEERASHK
jgi:hypothetical protein